MGGKEKHSAQDGDEGGKSLNLPENDPRKKLPGRRGNPVNQKGLSLQKGGPWGEPVSLSGGPQKSRLRGVPKKKLEKAWGTCGGKRDHGKKKKKVPY